MYKIYFVNFEYYSPATFETLDAAKVYCRAKSFESRIDLNGSPIMTWSPVSGFSNLYIRAYL